MSPLQAPPNRGYADYQRLSNMDSGTLITFPDASAIINQTSPVVDTSRYQYLGASLTIRENPVTITVSWFRDAAGALGAGFRQFSLSPTVVNGGQWRVPNLGPFVQVSVATIGGLSYTPEIAFWGTNRFYPVEFMPPFATLRAFTGQAIGAGANDTQNLFDLYAGPVFVWATMGQNGSLQAQHMDRFGVWQIINEFPITANVDFNQEYISPPAPLRMVMHNGSGVATVYNMTVTHSLTGGF